jgi:serine/threonine-protein kinase
LLHAAMCRRSTIVPADLRPWLAAMLQPDPAHRPASMRGLLETWPGPLPEASAQSVAKRTQAGAPWALPGAAVAALVLMLAVGAAGTAWWRFHEPEPLATSVSQPPPTTPATPDLAGLTDAGRLEDAFALFQQRIQEGFPPATSVS